MVCWREKVITLTIYLTLDLHQRITDKIEKINLRSKKRMQEVIYNTENFKFHFHKRTSCLFEPDPDSRLTSIVKVVRLSSNPFFPKSVKDKSMENFYFIGVDVSKKKLDFCVMFERKAVHEEETSNHQTAIMSLLYQLEEDYGDPRKFNCYVGIAPFSYSSGSSQHSKARVSHRADKVMKRLLHLAAVAVTHRISGELKKYYERKVAEGKNKMSVINALRAKIVARMFAVIKRNEKYKPILS